MDNVSNGSSVPRFGTLKITKAGGVEVLAVVALEAATVQRSLARITLGENPLQVFAEFIATLAIVELTVRTDQRPLEMARPSQIALPNGVDPRALRVES